MVSTRGIKVDFAHGECVLCFEPDLSKARVLYDAKVLDVLRSKNKQGQNKLDYMVHFQGWNNSWDRVVPASFIIKNTDRNRRLMRRLADIARHIKRNKSRMRRIDNILKEHFEVRPKFDSESSSSSDNDNDDEEEDDDNEEDDDDEDDEEQGSQDEESYRGNGKLHQESESEDEAEVLPLECNEPKEVVIELPVNLRKKLEHDCVLINRKDRLIQLPADPNIITILEGYVKNFGVNIICATVEKQKPYTRKEQRIELPEKNIDLCKEMMDGLRVFFDFALSTILLYNSEREQYERLLAARKPLVNYKPEPEDKKPVVQSVSKSRQSSSRCHGDNGEPPCKSLRLSPRVIKKEPNFSDDDDDGPPRRITRKAFQEEIRRSSLKSSESVKRTSESQDALPSTPEHKRGRGSTCPNSETKRSGKSRSQNKIDKPVKVSNERPRRRLSERVSPPPALRIPKSVSSSSSNVETPTSSMEQSLFHHRETAVNEMFSWKMLPDSEYERVPSAPSLIYGAHHLLRLFVKLPQYMEKMPIPSARLKIMVKHLEQFVEYMSSRADELFPDTEYVHADESFGWKDL